jgi:hypothetical protein
MNYLLLIWADGMPASDDLAMLQRDIPGWVEEMDRRGVRRFGRELDLPETASTVRVRDGRTVVTDGPFAETKEFIAGFDVLDCASLDEAIEVAARSPIARVQALEVRPVGAELELGERAFAFGRGEDGADRPYLLSVWAGAAAPTPSLGEETETWRQELAERGVQVLGNALGALKTARTIRVRDGRTLIGEGPGTEIDELLAEIDVVSCADRRQAIEVAATHPGARREAVEVRPFYVE